MHIYRNPHIRSACSLRCATCCLPTREAPTMEPRPDLLEVRRHGAVVTLTGEVDLNTSDLLRSELALACAAGDGDVVVDLTDLAFIGSSGLHVLIETATALGERRLVLLGG